MKNSAIRKALVILIAAVLLVCLIVSPITTKTALAENAVGSKTYDRASVSYRAGEGTKRTRM